ALLAGSRATEKLVVPLSTTYAEVVFSSTSPLIATLDSVPPQEVRYSDLPSVMCSSALLIVPPSIFHDPVAALSVMMFPVLVIVRSEERRVGEEWRVRMAPVE